MKIGIVGTSPTFIKAPYDDPSWEIWSCNSGGEPPRWDRWFQLHGDPVLDQLPGHREWLAGLTKPLYMQKKYAQIPNARAYPLKKIRAKYGDWFLTSTIALMMAMALEQDGLEEIGLWGVDMSHDSEYRTQKPGCRFFIQVARMRGIKLSVPEECDLLAPGRVYGYEPASWLAMKMRAKKAEMAGRAEDVNTQRQALVLEKAALRGALEIKLAPEDINKRLAVIAAGEADLAAAACVLDGGAQLADYVIGNLCGE